jgi:hypothetical protein
MKKIIGAMKMKFEAEQIQELAELNDLHVAPNPQGHRLVWVYHVVVDGDVYVRSHGVESPWTIAAKREGAGIVSINGVTYPVTFTPITESELQKRIDQAYIDRYSYSLADLHVGTVNETTIKIELKAVQ